MGDRPSLSHLFAHVRDLDAMRRFWTEIIGLELQADEGPYLRVGGGDGFGIGFEELPREQAGPEGFEIVVHVPNVDAAYERMRALGVAFDAPPADMPWGARSAWLRDPDGRRVSIYSMPAEGAGRKP